MDLNASVASELSRLECDYAFYFRRSKDPPITYCTAEYFPSASLIKLPMLLAWLHLERSGLVDRREECELDSDEQVQGAGLSWLLRMRQLPYQDVLLLMIALSDNLCANLIIKRAGMEQLNTVFSQVLGLQGTRLERRFMDHSARAEGKENWISTQDCIRLFVLRDRLDPEDRTFMDSMLSVNSDGGLWLRNLTRDTVALCHKTGSFEGVLHDWGYIDDRDLFLLTRNVRDESNVYSVLDSLGPLLLQAA